MDHELTTMWLSIDPMSDQYPSISPYSYCAWNPVKLVDPDGREVDMNPYLIFNGADKTLQIWDDNNTPDDYADDIFLGEYNASNNVSLRNNPKGKWEDGIYPMADTKHPLKHVDGNGNPIKDKKSIPKDSKGGEYGEHGIFRAKNFKQDDGLERSGMGIHAGRNVDDVTVLNSFTMGCIRTTPEAMEGIIEAISMFGPLTNVIVQHNRKSSKSNEANKIKHEKVIMLQTVNVTVSRQ